MPATTTLSSVIPQGTAALVNRKGVPPTIRLEIARVLSQFTCV
jgi:hypothetical protein